jgi:hypothetical protein
MAITMATALRIFLLPLRYVSLFIFLRGRLLFLLILAVMVIVTVVVAILTLRLVLHYSLSGAEATNRDLNRSKQLGLELLRCELRNLVVVVVCLVVVVVSHRPLPTIPAIPNKIIVIHVVINPVIGVTVTTGTITGTIIHVIVNVPLLQEPAHERRVG